MPTLGHTNCPLPVRESVWFEYILQKKTLNDFVFLELKLDKIEYS